MTGNAPTSRRRFLKAAAGATVGAGLTAAGANAPPAMRPIGEAEAILPAIAAAGVGGMAVIETSQWLQDHTAMGADEPPDGMSVSALKDRIYTTAQKRESTNASTFIDNSNLIQGTPHVAWADAKLAVIEALNDGLTLQECVNAGQTAVDDYATTIKRNLLKSWNESLNELQNLSTAASDAGIDGSGVLEVADTDGDGATGWNPWHGASGTSLSVVETSHTLPNGDSFTLKQIDATWSDNNSTWTPINESHQTSQYGSYTDPNEGIRVNGELQYLQHDEWNNIWSSIQSACQTVRDGVVTWTEGVYSDVQSGEIDTADLLTPREIAEMTAEEESDFNQAVADLMALNQPVNLDREAEVYIPASGSTLYGHLAVTGGGSVSTGEIDPASSDKDYYLTYDASEAEGEWGAYNTAVDGGIVTFTEEPYEGVEYEIYTAAEEMATVVYDDFVQDSGNWTVDISEQVDKAITEVSKVEYYALSEETDNYTVQLTDQFEVVTFRDDEGNTHDSATYEEPQTPQNDSNYMTQDEWEKQKQALLDQIEKAKQEQQSGGGGGLIGGNGGMLAVGVGALAGGYAMLFGGDGGDRRR